jgi:hypothetical protein
VLDKDKLMPRSEMYRRARQAMLRAAFLSPQSLSILFVTLFGLGLQIEFLGGEPWLWAIFGLVSEMFFIGATFTDQRAASAAVSRMFRQRYDPSVIRNPHARQRLDQALEYFRNMQELSAQTSGARHVQIEATIDGIDSWIEQIFRIARRIDNYAENALINRDRLRVPNEINVLQQRLAHESDSGIQDELEDAIQLKRRQLDNLQHLENNIKRADIQLDNTLAALGTIYAQLQLMDSKAVGGSRAHRLKQEINTEIMALQDTIDAIDDVQASSYYTLSTAAGS